MSLVAKFRCDSVAVLSDATSEEKQSERVSLSAVYSDDPAHENYSWSKLTPAGHLSLTISNPTAFGLLEVGKQYRLTIEPA